MAESRGRILYVLYMISPMLCVLFGEYVRLNLGTWQFVDVALLVEALSSGITWCRKNITFMSLANIRPVYCTKLSSSERHLSAGS